MQLVIYKIVRIVEKVTSIRIINPGDWF